MERSGSWVDKPLPLSISNHPRRILPGPHLLHKLIHRNGPEDNIAIEYLSADGAKTSLSYRQLDALTDLLAEKIKDTLKLFPGNPAIIPVIVPQSPELYTSWIAVLKAEAAFCPVAPDTPQERLTFILRDVSAKVAMCLPGYEDTLRAVQGDISVITVPNPVLQDKFHPSHTVRHTQPDPDPREDSIAYVMYTSGSTGQPKGVRIPHFSVSQSLLAHDEHIPKFTRFLQFAAPTFDVSVFETFFPLFRGATMVCCDRERMLADLAGTMRALHVDAAELTPTVAGTLLQSRKAAPCLKILLTIGEMLTRHVIEEFGGSSMQESMLYAMYGPTEASIHCTIAPKLSGTSPVSSIGRPLATVTALILSRSGDSPISPILPIGQSGELAVAGQLATGYLNRLDQTTAAFVKIPGYGTVYRTGDYARMFNDGKIEILGRMSSGQVKVRGQRVELGEIEHAISRTPNLRQATVSMIDNVIVAFCVTNSDEGLANTVLATCKRWLPRFMIPGDVVIRHELPRLHSGKVDRKKLEAEYLLLRSTETDGRAEMNNEVESEITGYIEAELETKVSLTSSLWSNGLNSLRAIKIASRMRSRFPSITVSSILESDSVAGLASILAKRDKLSPRQTRLIEDSEKWQALTSETLAQLRLEDDVDKVSAIRPCSPLQLAMLAETYADKALNYSSIELDVCPRVSLGRLRLAFGTVAQTSEILRSGFVYTSDEAIPFAQVVWDSLELVGEISLLRPFRLRSHPQRPGKATVCIHHALYDGWSWNLVLDDVNKVIAGNTPTSRASFSWVRKYQRSLEPDDHFREYWQARLRDGKWSRLPNLCVSRLEKPGPCRRSRNLTISLDSLAASCFRMHISNQSLVCAAWMLLLGHYTGSHDVLSGMITSGRSLPIDGIDGIIGPCINTFPLRADLTCVKTVRDLLQYVHRLQQDLLRFEGFNLQQVKSAAGLKGDRGLFDSLFVWQEGLSSALRAPNVVETANTTDSLHYPLVLEAEPRAGEVTLKVTLDTSVIPEQQGELLLGQLDHLVATFAQQPELDISEAWQDTELRLLAVANHRPVRFDETFSLTSTIERLAEEEPNRIAIEFVHDYDPSSNDLHIEKVTYLRLHQRAVTIGHKLMYKWLVSKDDIVCILIPKSVNLYAVILAAILVGAGYMCVDSRTPPERISQILRVARPKLIIGDSHHPLSEEYETLGSYTSIDKLSEPAKTQKTYKSVVTGPSSLAYLTFTSGSTGVPKGVLITRQNLASNIQCLSKIYPYHTGTDKLLQACSPAFDVSVFEIFWTWHTGMTLCAASNDIIFRDLEKFICITETTHLSMTPSVAALVDPRKVPSVKMLVTAGEPMNSKVFQAWADRGLYQGYGPSETTNICNIKPNVSENDFPNNVGIPLSNTSIFIGERHSAGGVLRILPVGAAGEIWIGGDQVGRGYVDSMSTKRSFIEHPLYGHLYRSGDTGRLLADGSLVIVGREDEQIKIRGQRIELGDVNAALVRTPLVTDAVTVVIDEANSGHRLVSFWVSAQACVGDRDIRSKSSSIFDGLQAQLPTYMIPDALISVPRLPLTNQGKVDKRALVKHFRDLRPEELSICYRNDGGYSNDHEPLSERESEIAKVLSEITGCSSVNINRNTSFFALGIDSISGIRLAQTLRERSLAQVDVSTILSNSTIGVLMTKLGTGGTKDRLSSTSRCQRLAKVFDEPWIKQIRSSYFERGFIVEKILPCSPLQEAMLSKSAAGTSAAYQNRLRFRVTGELAKLEGAWTRMVTRHQILRTGFVASDSVDHPYAQVVLKQFGLPWCEGSQPSRYYGDFDSLQLPPYQLFLKSRGCDSVRVLVLQMHHALYDAEAMSHLLHEIEQSYSDQILPDVVSFDHYLEHCLRANTAECKHFWQDQLASVSPCLLASRLASRFSDRSDNKAATANITASISLKGLREKAQDTSTTILTWLQTAWARLLSHCLQVDYVCFGNVFNGRNLPIEGIGRMVGPTFNTLPVHARVADLLSNIDLARAFHTVNLGILPLQQSSLRSIQKTVSSSLPLFDTMLLLQKEPVELDSSIWTLEEDVGYMDFPLIVEIIPDSGRNLVSIVLHHRIDDVVAEAILHAYDVLLKHSVCFSEARAGDYSCLATDISKIVSRGLKVANVSGVEDTKAGTKSHPWSQVELQIRQILSELAHVDESKITKDTTIYRMGLDSINAIQIASKLRKLNFSVTGSDILESPTIEGIVAVCRARYGIAEGGAGFDLQAFDQKHHSIIARRLRLSEQNIEAVKPCTSTQSGIISQFIRSRGLHYFNTFRVGLPEDIDELKLQAAWQAASGRHAILRTGFLQTEDIGNTYLMVTYPPGVHQLPWKVCSKSTTDLPDSSLGTTMLERLHRPPWGISFMRNNDYPVLIISMLHAMYDAKALDLILDDVTEIYSGRLLSKPVSTDLTLSMILAAEDENESSKAFWRESAKQMQQTIFPDMKVYQFDRSEMVVTSRNCSTSPQEIEKNCRGLGVTLQTVCQAAWAQVLAAYTGQEKVTFGVILSGRVSKHRENVVFPCINTVPCAVNVTSNITCRLAAVTENNAGLVKHQFTPFTSIKKWSSLVDDLYDTVLVLQKYETTKSEGHWPIISDSAQAEYTVSLEIIPEGTTNTQLRLTFQETVLPLPQAEIMLQQFDALLAVILKTNETAERLSQCLLSVIPAKVNRIETDVRFLHDFVERTALETPDSVAFEFATSIDDGNVNLCTWTYQQLDEEANKIANLIIQNGAMPGDLIGVCFDKCPEASFAILGVLKAGCAYVAVDPNAPLARQGFILQDAACKVLLTTTDKLAHFAVLADVVILCMNDPCILRKMPSGKPSLQRALNPEDTCYCLYTSGTTGTPKGCLISHNSAVQAMLSFQRIFEGHWDKYSRWLQFASFHFDVSVLEQYWSWSVGIRVTSAPRDLLFEGLPAAIKALKITHLDLTPSLARLLDPKELPDLCRGVFIVGGEQVRQDILDIWGDVGCLYNFYGPSEVTIGCTVRKEVPKDAKATNIGQQWDNVGTFVLDVHSQHPVLRGAIGELCLSGPLVGKGYLNREELTKKNFVVLEDCGVRVYRTGDLVRLLHDDSFEFLGRIDDQTKLRGQRLEIAEINHVVHGASIAIKDVATMVLKHPNQAKEQLVSFYSTRPQHKGVTPAISWENEDAKLAMEIRDHCVENLPSYMVSTYILPLSVMPLTTNNKVDSRALRSVFDQASLDQLRPPSSTELVPSAVSADASGMIEVLANFLSIPPSTVNIASRFFELGLDSISIVAFSGALRRSGFPQVDPSMIVSNGSVAALCRSLAHSRSSGLPGKRYMKEVQDSIRAFDARHRLDLAASLKVLPDDIECIAPCTPLQEGMIATTLGGDGKNLVYFSTFTYDLGRFANGMVDLQQLQKAWDVSIAELQILRTRFVATNDGYAQVVLEPDTCPALRYLSHRDTEAAESQQQQWLRIGQDFGEKPCWEVRFLHEGTARIQMQLSIFHALYDAISLPLVIRTVARNYLKMENPTSAPSYHQALPHGPLSRPLGARDYWSKTLRSATLLDLPVKHEDSQTAVTCTATFKSGAGLEKYRRQLNTTWSSVFLSAWLLLLQKHFKIVPTVGVVVSGRSISLEHVDEVVGPMFNTIPCAIPKLATNSRWDDLIGACSGFVRESMPFQHTALRDVAKWTKLALPHFDTLFVFHGRSTVEEGEADQVLVQRDSMSFPVVPLALEIGQVGEDFVATIVAQSKHLELKNLKAMGEDLGSILSRLGEENPLLSEEFLGAPPDLPHERMVEKDSSVVDKNYEWTDLGRILQEHLSNLSDSPTESIGPDTTIFGLGLDSIDAIRLSSRVKSTGLSISVKDIMQFPTIRGMLGHIPNTAEAPKPPMVDLHALDHHLRRFLRKQNCNLQDTEMVMPVTPMQEGIVANYGKYYNFTLLRVAEGVELGRLMDSFEEVFQRYEIFRTRFVQIEAPESDSTYVQVVQRERSQKKLWSNGTDTPLQLGHLNVVMAEKLEEIRKDGLRYPAVSLTLVLDQESGSFSVLMGLSHAVYDAWSMELFHKEVRRTYQWQALGEIATASVQRHMEVILTTQNSGEEFWKRYLKGARPSILPQIPNPGLPHRFEVVSKVSTQAITFCLERASVTMQSLGLACWTLTLMQCLRSLDVCFGVVLSGRTSDGAEDLMFPTFNTVVFRSDTEAGMTAAEFLKKTHEISTEIAEVQHFPLRKALRLAERTGGEFFNTLFVFQRKLSGKQEDRGAELYVQVDADAVEHLKPAYPLNIEMEVKDEVISWTGVCEGHIMDEQGLKRCLEMVDEILKWVVENDDAKILEGDEDGKVSICELPAISLLHEPKVPDGLPPAKLPQPHELANSTKAQELSGMEDAIRKTLAVAVNLDDATGVTKTMNIFQLGLDSISAIKVVGLLKKDHDIVLPVSEMIKAGTVERMALVAKRKPLNGDVATMLSNAESQQSPTEVVAETSSHHDIDIGTLLQSCDIRTEDVEAVIPATAGQSYILGTWQASQGQLFYPTFTFVAHGVSTDGLRSAWTRLVVRLPILRTTFVRDEEGNTWQIVIKADGGGNEDICPWTFAVEDSIANGLLYVRLKIHHALYDAVSLGLIVKELKRECELQDDFDCSLNTSFGRFINVMQGDRSVEQKRKFWTEYLALAGKDETKSGSAAVLWNQALRGTRYEAFRPKLINVNALKAAARPAGVSAQALFFALIAQIYHSMTVGGRVLRKRRGSVSQVRDSAHERGEAQVQPSNMDAEVVSDTTQEEEDVEYVAIGIYLANRSLDFAAIEPETDNETAEKLVAPTLNIVPLKVRLFHPTATPTLRQLIDVAAEVQKDLAEIGRHEHCGVSLREVFDWTGLRVDCVINWVVDFDSEKDVNNLADAVSIIPVPHNANAAGANVKGKQRENNDPAAAHQHVALDGPSPFFASPVDDDDDDDNSTRLEWCVPIVDVEAKVEGDGLSVGVFGWDVEVEEWLETLQGGMEQILK